MGLLAGVARDPGGDAVQPGAQQGPAVGSSRPAGPAPGRRPGRRRRRHGRRRAGGGRRPAPSGRVGPPGRRRPASLDRVPTRGEAIDEFAVGHAGHRPGLEEGLHRSRDGPGVALRHVRTPPPSCSLASLSSTVPQAASSCTKFRHGRRTGRGRSPDWPCAWPVPKEICDRMRAVEHRGNAGNHPDVRVQADDVFVGLEGGRGDLATDRWLTSVSSARDFYLLPLPVTKPTPPATIAVMMPIALSGKPVFGFSSHGNIGAGQESDSHDRHHEDVHHQADPSLVSVLGFLSFEACARLQSRRASGGIESRPASRGTSVRR